MRKWIIYLLIALIALSMFACKGSERIVEVDKVHTEYKDRIVQMTDSIYICDSVITYLGGDTTYIYKYRNVYKDRVRVDTLLMVRRDSVVVPMPVERNLTPWQKLLQDVGKFSLLFLLMIVIVWVIKPILCRARGNI